MKEETVRAMLDEDIEVILRKLEQLDAVQQGEVYCSQCGIPLALKNIQIIVPLGESRFQYVCNRTECVEAYGKGQEVHDV